MEPLERSVDMENRYDLRGWRGVASWCALYLLFLVIYFCLRGPGITHDPTSNDRFYHLTGDEPHYLLLAHSMAFDTDVDLHNNKKDRDWEAFSHKKISGYTKRKSYWLKFARGHVKNGSDEYWARRAYSICPVGLPALITPAYRIGWHWGKRVRFTVVIWLQMLAALLACLCVWMALRVTHNWFASLLVGVAIPLSGPLLYYTNQIYTDLPAGLCIAASFWLISRAQSRLQQKKSCTMALFSLGLVLSLLLWLHTKFWLHAAVLVVCAVTELNANRGMNRRSQWLCMAAPLAASFAAVSFYHYLLYGVPLPVSVHPELSVAAGLARGWPGLWFDRDSGLFAYIPLAVLFVSGVAELIRIRHRLGLWMTGMILVHWAAVGIFPDWRGGLCPPLRYWVPVVALFAAPCSAIIGAVRTTWFRLLAALTAATGIWFGVVGMLHSGRLYDYYHPVMHRVLYRWPWIRYSRWSPLFNGQQPIHTAVTAVLAATGVIVVTIVALRLVRTSRINERYGLV